MRSKIFEAEVEVDLDEWSTEELIEEVELRRKDEACPGLTQPRFQALYDAIVTGNEMARDVLLREILYETTGRILP